MIKFNVILSILVTIIKTSNGYHSGPFLLWGLDQLKDIKLPALDAINEKTLTDMFSDTKAVIIFVRNTTYRLDKENFPSFNGMITNSPWTYLPQNLLPADPVDYNSNVEIINLDGPISQQDVELTALYRDAETIYGTGEVLGILANQGDEHIMYKRELKDDELSPESVSTQPEELQDDLVYLVKGKGLLYTTSAPVLYYNPDFNTTDEKSIIRVELSKHSVVTFDSRDKVKRLAIKFPDEKITIKFVFPPPRGGYWTLTEAEVVYNGPPQNKLSLAISGKIPYAPAGFSYKCSSPLVFKKGETNLTLQNFQIQPDLNDDNRFGDAYDCVGFTTAPIWSGIFVSFIILIGTIIGVVALMEIKTPNRFESSRSKQLTFTIQE